LTRPCVHKRMIECNHLYRYENGMGDDALYGPGSVI
jgi:hypothetical protein